MQTYCDGRSRFCNNTKNTNSGKKNTLLGKEMLDGLRQHTFFNQTHIEWYYLHEVLSKTIKLLRSHRSCFFAALKKYVLQPNRLVKILVKCQLNILLYRSSAAGFSNFPLFRLGIFRWPDSYRSF